jgi:hypothetical protein
VASRHGPIASGLVVARRPGERGHRLLELAAQALQLAHGGEQRGRLDEAALGVGRGVAGVAQGALDRRADLPRRFEVLVARLVQVAQAAVQRLDQGRQRAGLDPQAAPALGLHPAVERLAHHRQLRAHDAQLLGGTRRLAVMREQDLDLLGDLGEHAPSRVGGERAQIGDAPGGEAVRESVEVADDAAIEPHGEGDADQDADRRDRRDPEDQQRQVDLPAGVGAATHHQPHARGDDQRAAQAAEPQTQAQPRCRLRGSGPLITAGRRNGHLRGHDGVRGPGCRVECARCRAYPPGPNARHMPTWRGSPRRAAAGARAGSPTPRGGRIVQESTPDRNLKIRRILLASSAVRSGGMCVSGRRLQSCCVFRDGVARQSHRWTSP